MIEGLILSPFCTYDILSKVRSTIGGSFVNDRAVVLLEQYDLEVLETLKGRGMFIAKTPQKEVALKEFFGNKEKLEWEEAFVEGLTRNGFSWVDCLIRNKEGELIVYDYEGVSYILKNHIAGRECSVTNLSDCVMAMEGLAKLHIAMRKMMEKPLYICHRKEKEKESEDQMEEEPGFYYEKILAREDPSLDELINRTRPGFLSYETTKKTAELLRARQFIRKKASKNEFDLLFLKEFERFFEQMKTTQSCLSQQELQSLEEYVKKRRLYCHGDCNQHNILITWEQIYFQNFEKIRPDLQVKDLYLFVRKVCEKNKWDFTFGQKCIDAYQSVLPLSRLELKYLLSKFIFPEKFSKIASGYMAHNKSLPPRRQEEKLNQMLLLEPNRKRFLEQYQSYYSV